MQDPIVVGNTFGRVRAMTNDLGRRVKVAGPSTPVSIRLMKLRWLVTTLQSMKMKKLRVQPVKRRKRALLKQRQATHRVSLENLFDTLKAGEVKSVNVIIKADVQGSVEALSLPYRKLKWKALRLPSSIQRLVCYQ